MKEENDRLKAQLEGQNIPVPNDREDYIKKKKQLIEQVEIMKTERGKEKLRHKQEIENMKSELSIKSLEISSLQSKVDMLQVSSSSAGAEGGALAKWENEIIREKSRLEEERNLLMIENQSLKQNSEKLREQLQKAEITLSEVQMEKTESKSLINQLNFELVSVKRATSINLNDESNQEGERLKKETAKRSIDLESKVKTLENEREQAQNEKEALRKEIQVLKSKVQEITHKELDKLAAIDKLQNEKSWASQEVESLRTDVEKYLRLFQADELRISELMIKISDLEDNLKSKKTECDRLEKEKISTVEKSFEYQKMLERLTSDKLALQKDLSEAKIEHQKTISELRLNNDALKKEKKAYVKKIEKLEKERSDATGERDKLRLELTDARSHQQKDKVSIEVN